MYTKNFENKWIVKSFRASPCKHLDHFIFKAKSKEVYLKFWTVASLLFIPANFYFERFFSSREIFVLLPHIEYGGIPSVHVVLFYVPVCYLLFSMTDLYPGQICRGVSKLDSALWEINSVVLILSARLHQFCVLWEHQRCLSLRNYFFPLCFKMPIKSFPQKYNCSWQCEKYN